MPVEIIPHVMYLSEVDKEGDVEITSEHENVYINKEQGEKIISHLQEQFKLKPYNTQP